MQFELKFQSFMALDIKEKKSVSFWACFVRSEYCKIFDLLRWSENQAQ